MPIPIVATMVMPSGGKFMKFFTDDTSNSTSCGPDNMFST